MPCADCGKTKLTPFGPEAQLSQPGQRNAATLCVTTGNLNGFAVGVDTALQLLEARLARLPRGVRELVARMLAEPLASLRQQRDAKKAEAPAYERAALTMVAQLELGATNAAQQALRARGRYALVGLACGALVGLVLGVFGTVAMR